MKDDEVDHLTSLIPYVIGLCQALKQLNDLEQKLAQDAFKPSDKTPCPDSASNSCCERQTRH